MESGALQDFPIHRSARDCVYLRFTDENYMQRKRTAGCIVGEQRRQLWIKKKKKKKRGVLRNERKEGKQIEGDEQAEAKPLLSARKSCSLEREFLENREKLVIKARERKQKKRRRDSEKGSETERIREGDESCRIGQKADGGSSAEEKREGSEWPRKMHGNVFPGARAYRQRNRKMERNVRAERGTKGCDRGRDWDAEDIIRVEKPTPRTITEKLCLILPTGPASAIVILHFAPLRPSFFLYLSLFLSALRRIVPVLRVVCLAQCQRSFYKMLKIEIYDITKITCPSLL